MEINLLLDNFGGGGRGSYTFVSLNSKLKRNKEAEKGRGTVHGLEDVVSHGWRVRALVQLRDRVPSYPHYPQAAGGSLVVP